MYILISCKLSHLCLFKRHKLSIFNLEFFRKILISMDIYYSFTKNYITIVILPASLEANS